MDQKIDVAGNLKKLISEINNKDVTLVAVSKTKPVERLMEVYDTGHRDFGENKVQELLPKQESLPEDIKWHFIGHLQRNKVKYIVPFVHLIHSVDSLKLLKEINKQGRKINKEIPCLLQMHIAREETKFGLDEEEIRDIFENHLKDLTNVKILGLMGMATFTDNKSLINSEFSFLKTMFDSLKAYNSLQNVELKYLSMGMSNDYKIALENGSNMLRVGSTIFGERS